MMSRITRWYYFIPALATVALAAKPALAQFGENLNVGGLSNRELVPFVVSIINVVLGFLALIALILILVAGFNWMIASGETEKVDKARKSIYHAIGGLVVIFLAWAIVNFVIGVLKNT